MANDEYSYVASHDPEKEVIREATEIAPAYGWLCVVKMVGIFLRLPYVLKEFAEKTVCQFRARLVFVRPDNLGDVLLNCSIVNDWHLEAYLPRDLTNSSWVITEFGSRSISASLRSASATPSSSSAAMGGNDWRITVARSAR